MIKRLGIRNIARLLNPLWNNLFGVWNAESLSTTLDTNIFASWEANGNPNDSVGTNHGTLINGVTFTTGKNGQAFNFDSEGQSVKFTEDSVNFTNNFTISLWFKCDGGNNGNGMLFSNYHNDGSGDYGYFIFKIGNTISWRIYSQGNSNNKTVTIPNYSDNTWYHVVVTANNTVEGGFSNGIFINNTLVGYNTYLVNPRYASPTNSQGTPNTMKPQIGGSAGWSFRGQIDSINIWDRRLTSNEIYQLYNLGNGTEYPFSSKLLPSPNDLVGTNHGTLMNGATFTTGKIGSSFTFDGVNDYISLPNNSLDLVGDFTISMWIYHTSIATTGQNLLSNRFYQTTPTNIHEGWSMHIDNLTGQKWGRITFLIAGGATNTYFGWEFRDTPLTLNAWNHVVIKRVSGVNTYCWVNNTPQTYNQINPGARSSITVDPTYNTTQPVAIGAGVTTGVPSIFMANNSKIDAVSIWNRELTEDEITELYNSGNGKQYPN